MEKRRRARMNASLAELKALLLEVMKKEGARHSKMEKADILEMTVKHVRQLQRQHFSVSANEDPTIINKYRLGFNECATEVSRYLNSVDEVNIEVRARLLNHLACYMTNYGSSSTPNSSISSSSSVSESSSCLSPNIPTLSPKSASTPQISIPKAQSSSPVVLTVAAAAPSVPTPPSKPIVLTTEACTTTPVASLAAASSTTTTTSIGTCTSSTNTTTISNTLNGSLSFTSNSPLQTAKFVSGVQLIPTKLPSGEVALVFPANVMAGTQTQQPSYIIPIYASTPPAVSPLTTTVSSTPSVMAFLPQVATSGLKTCAVTPIQNTSNISQVLSNATNPQITTTTVVPSLSDHLQICSEPNISSISLPSKMSPPFPSSKVTTFPSLSEHPIYNLDNNNNNNNNITTTTTNTTTTTATNNNNNNNNNNPVALEPLVMQHISEENVWRPWAY
uniref:Uncharacterized protein n=2 Tax=Octopus bimaculoides TaxID=37653 RepID=A0A0L8HFY6_OCTBM